MKNLLILLLLICIGLPAMAQQAHVRLKDTVNAGTNGFVIINGQRYARGSINSHYDVIGGSGYLSILRMTDPVHPVCPTTLYSNYIMGDSSYAAFSSYANLQKWMDTYFEYHSN